MIARRKPVSVRARTHLLFVNNNAAKALDLYREVFADLAVQRVDRYDSDGGGEGLITVAYFTLAGQSFSCADSPGVQHGFGFTPATSIAVEFATADEVDAAVSRLAAGGAILMPLDAYDFSPRFAWVVDAFGVSWQLQLASGAPTG